MSTSLRFPALFAALFILVSNNVAAINFCLPQNAPKRFVGDVATDGLCTDNDIQSAINNVTGSCPTIIYITREHLYTAQHLIISNQSVGVTLAGVGDGVHCGSTAPQICDPTIGCPPPPTGPLVTIDGSNSGGRVLSIIGNSNVSLSYLRFTGGSADSSLDGGGIDFTGYGTLSLDTSTVDHNYAGYGGGISVTASGGTATLNLLDNTLVTFNTAQVSGGGIRIEGYSQLAILGKQSLVGVNHALEGYGGGVEVIGPARADISSPGYGGLGVIYSNDAPRGGGIAAFGSSDTFFQKPGVVNLFTTDPANPVRVQGNFASVAGGAMYAKGYVDQANNQNEADLCASHFRIDENSAPDGAAVYLDWDTSVFNPDLGGRLLLNRGACGGGGVRCAAGVPCDLISDNVAEDSLGQPTNGAVILVGSNSTFQADGLVMRNNVAGQLVNTVGDSYSNYRGPGLLHNCLLADNSTSLDLLALSAETFTIDNCTIAGNNIGGTWVLTNADTLTNSLIFQPGTSVGSVISSATTKYVLSHDISHLPADVTIQKLIDPRFVNAAGGDYHLQVTSPAVDFAGGLGGVDLEYRPRDIDLPGIANKFGPRDLGAYETQRTCGAADTIFCNGFDAYQ